MIFFISDLHLDESRADITAAFFQLLNYAQQHASAMYILGDLFEFWIGDDAQTSLHQTVSTRLQALGQKIPVYFLPGNRDFLVGNIFLTQCNCSSLQDPTVIDLYGVPTLLTHGDALCTADRAHQWFRCWSQKRWVQRLFLGLPLTWRRRIAEFLRRNPYRKSRDAMSMLWDVVDATLLAWLKQYQVRQIIYGHTHRPSIRWLWQTQEWLRCTVLSDWERAGNVLIYYPDGRQRLITVGQVHTILGENYETMA